MGDCGRWIVPRSDRADHTSTCRSLSDRYTDYQRQCVVIANSHGNVIISDSYVLGGWWRLTIDRIDDHMSTDSSAECDSVANDV